MTNKQVRRRIIKISTSMVLLGIVALSLGYAFLFIFMGLYGFIIFATPYSEPIRHIMEAIFSTDFSKIKRPISSTSPNMLLTSLFLIVIRLGLIVAGIYVLYRVGFKDQNLFWLILHH